MNHLVRDRLITSTGGLTPYTGPELFGWWDPSDALNVTKSGGRFDQVNDKSGNSNHLTSSGSLRPFDSRTLNGLDVLDFQGGQQIGKDVISSQAHPNVIIMLGKSDLNDTYRAFFNGKKDGQSAISNAYYAGDPSGNHYMYSDLELKTSPMDTLTHIITLVFNSGNSKLYIDGVLRMQGNTGASSLTSISLGARYNKLSQFLDGYIGDCFFYSSIPTDAQLNQTGQYLSSKYAKSYTDI